MSVSVDKTLVENYANYYDQGDRLSEWRRLGAKDKCANIQWMCARFEHSSILEIGCGEGAIMEALSKLEFGSSFVGLEISPSAINAVEKRGNPRLKVRLFDGYTVPFAEQQFDLAILSHVLEHVEHPRLLINEASRVASRVFVEVPLEDNWRLSPDFVFDQVGHLNFFNVKTIRHLVQSCGMKILGAKLSHGSPASYIFRKGKFRGMSSYVLKEVGLHFGSWMSSLLTYNYALICTKSADGR